MPSRWNFFGSGDGPDNHNLQEGLLQIASQTCNILVQVNNTNNISFGDNATNIQYNNFNPSNGSFASTSRGEQSVVLIPPTITTTTTTKTTFNRRLSRGESARRLFSNYKHRLSTVLEGSNQHGDDDFELWDQSQMFRAEQNNGSNKWNQGGWCKPSCIPISVILTLIILVVLLPLLEHANEKTLHAKNNGSSYICVDECNIQLVESIPEGLNFSNDSPRFMSTFDAWNRLLSMSTDTIELGSFYWTLRGADIYNHSSAWQGEQIFQQILAAGTQRKIKIRIAQSVPTQNQPNLDTELLIKRQAAEVRTVNFPKFFGSGVLHTKLWVVDGQHFYIGSANMDWRSLTQVKELGVLVTNCTCLAKDVSKIFNSYWFLGRNNSHVPSNWPEEYSTKFNLNTPIHVNFNEQFEFKTFFSNSPPPLNARGRTNDMDAIINTILQAEKFVHIAVMDYFPLTIFTPKITYWAFIDDAIRKAAVEHRVSVKLLISWWNHSRPSEDYFLRSLKSLSHSMPGVDIEVKRFIIPSDDDQEKIPFGRVNHNKYMVTDTTAYIGTSNWSGDYFIDTAGIGLVLRDSKVDRSRNETTIRTQLASVFERDWNSQYAVDLLKEA